MDKKYPDELIKVLTELDYQINVAKKNLRTWRTVNMSSVRMCKEQDLSMKSYSMHEHFAIDSKLNINYLTDVIGNHKIMRANIIQEWEDQDEDLENFLGSL